MERFLVRRQTGGLVALNLFIWLLLNHGSTAVEYQITPSSHPEWNGTMYNVSIVVQLLDHMTLSRLELQYQQGDSPMISVINYYEGKCLVSPLIRCYPHLAVFGVDLTDVTEPLRVRVWTDNQFPAASQYLLIGYKWPDALVTELTTAVTTTKVGQMFNLSCHLNNSWNMDYTSFVWYTTNVATPLNEWSVVREKGQVWHAYRIQAYGSRSYLSGVLRPGDEGSYYCRCKYGRRSERRSGTSNTYYLNVTYPPTTDARRPSRYYHSVAQHEIVTLHWHVMANPQPGPATWRRDGELISVNGSGYSQGVVDEGSSRYTYVLTFTASPDTFGYYECSTDNDEKERGVMAGFQVDNNHQQLMMIIFIMSAVCTVTMVTFILICIICIVHKRRRRGSVQVPHEQEVTMAPGGPTTSDSHVNQTYTNNHYTKRRQVLPVVMVTKQRQAIPVMAPTIDGILYENCGRSRKVEVPQKSRGVIPRVPSDIDEVYEDL